MIQSLKSVRKKSKWAIDYDYIHLLSEDDKIWLAEFTNYYYHGSPNRCKVIKITDEMKKESYNLNNQRERDIYTKSTKLELNKVDNINLDKSNKNI